MHLLSNCQLESSSSSSCTMFMSRCHKTVSKLSKQSSNCSKVGLLLSSQSTSVTLTWVTAKAGYGQWLELGSIKNHFTAYWELPNTWGMIISGSWATLDFTWGMSFFISQSCLRKSLNLLCRGHFLSLPCQRRLDVISDVVLSQLLLPEHQSYRNLCYVAFWAGLKQKGHNQND